jgi:hypothetical protein
LNNPEYAKIGEKKYKINTDYKVAIECDRIANDGDIDDTERALAIIYLLFGDEGLKDSDNYNKLMEIAIKYLSCGKEIITDEEPDMDYIQDMDYIKTSFMSDYGIELTDMHWWTFFNLINGLSNSEFGNCCVLNRIRNIRTYDESKIEDTKEREKFRKYKESVKLKKKVPKLTEKQKESVENFYKLTGIKRKE